MDVPAVALVREPERIEAAISPLRRELLARLGQPDSATGLARKLGMPRQRVNYHLRELERSGLVELVAERPRRGLVERLLQRVATVLLVDPGVLGAGQLPARDRAGALGVIAAAAEVLGDVAEVTHAAAADQQRLATATVDTTVRFGSPADAHAFVEDLAALCARYDRGEAPGVAFRILSVLYPRRSR